MLAWPHSGFHVHDAVQVPAEDVAFAVRLARYCARNPVALDRLAYSAQGDRVTYRSDKTDGPTAGSETLDPLEFLARVVTHIPDKHQVMTRYYGVHYVRDDVGIERRPGCVTCLDSGPTAGSEALGPLEFLARVVTHIPDKHQVMTRCCGRYRNRPRGARRHAGETTDATPIPMAKREDLTLTVARRRWAELLRQGYEVDPLQCPRVGAPCGSSRSLPCTR